MSVTQSWDSADVRIVWDEMRRRAPRVHCIMNTVAQSFTANLLLAAGAVPSMTSTSEEVAAFVGKADGMLINLGTLDPDRQKAILLAVDAATQRGRPFVLDPVFIDTSSTRAALALSLARMGPAAVRLNAAEFTALTGDNPDLVAIDVAAEQFRSVIAVTGAVDLISDASRSVRLAHGHVLMTRVAAVGCASGALIAACLAVTDDAFLATSVALAAMGVAGEIAGAAADGPGSFASLLLDALYRLDGAALTARMDAGTTRFPVSLSAAAWDAAE